jgi:competence protein ComEC
MTPSKIFYYFSLSFIGGIFLSSFFNFPPLILKGLLILGIILIFLLLSHKKLVVIGFCILFLVLGIWRHQQIELEILNSELRKLNDLDKQLTLIGIVSAEPDIREKTQKLTIKIEDLKGKVLVTTNRYPEYQYGDKLKITGKLKTPQVFEDFNYKDYLLKDGIYSVMDWPKIELLERGNYQNLTQLIYAKILILKNKLREAIFQNLSPPQSSILAAMILGDKKTLSEETKTKLNVTGMRHITAISGLHITILSTILMTILLGFGLWRQQAFWFSIILIIFFVIMTGLQPSATRAAIMGGLYLLAQYFGKIGSSSRIIVFAAVLMLLLNPLLLRYDVGFQLSFLAMLGIIYLSPIFQDWFKKIPNVFQLRNLLSMTLSAQVFTLPILIYNFGYFSIIAPITNILIVPLLPYIMGLGFFSGLGGIIFPLLGKILSLPCWLLLTYLIKLIDWFSSFSFIFLTIKISWVLLILSYLFLALITWRLTEKQRLKFLKY